MNIYAQIVILSAIAAAALFGLAHALLRVMAQGTSGSMFASLALFIIVLASLHFGSKAAGTMREMHRQYRQFGSF